MSLNPAQDLDPVLNGKDQSPPQVERLLFELTRPGNSAIDLPDLDVPPVDARRVLPAELVADEPPALPEVGELTLVRHFTRLASRIFSVDANFYPLGSCTMKYNPKVSEKLAGLDGLLHVHPHQYEQDVQGLLRMLYDLRTWLQEISGLAEASLQPAAGAHGELTSLMVINAYHADRGENRTRVLVPDTAHGTNPASCSLCSRFVITVESRPDGRVDLDDLRRKVDQNTAAMMITNPSTVGLFENQIRQIAEIVHEAGAMLYMDGANMNAIVGLTRPGDFGADIMHFNTHKTFATPHGCGGPGAGPIACTEPLAPYLPVPQVVRRDDGTYGWNYDRPKTIGKVRSFYGQVGVLVRAYCYILALGPEGLRDVAEKAVLSANYLAARIKGKYSLPFAGPYAHEFITVPEFREKGVTELDIAKRLLDFGIHPPTMSWPVPHCLMIEPTECESLYTLDRFADVLLKIADEAASTPDVLHFAPHKMPVARLDEVAAARKPNLRWRPEQNGTSGATDQTQPQSQAARQPTRR
jgi:glycine dehydrogenase subunit 2